MTIPYFVSNAKLWYVEETTVGTTPATPAFKQFRITADNLVLQKESLQSNEIDGSREISAIRTSANQVTGTVSGELSSESYDDLFEACLQGTWATDVLKVGSTERAFTFMRETLDSSGATHYDLFTGCRITNFSMSTAVNSIVTIDFSVIGEGADYDATEPAGATYTAANTNAPFIFVDGTLSIDSTSYALVTGVTQTNDNAAAANFALGSNNLAFVGFGRANNTLTVDGAYFDTTVVDAFQNETEVQLDLVFSLSGDSMTFSYPRCIFTSGAPTLSSDTQITYSANVQAIKDSTEATSLKITRVVV